MNGELRGKKIIIFQQRGWAKRIGYFLAERLQAEGCCLAALTLRRKTHEMIEKQKVVKYEKIINIDDIFEDPRKYLGNEKITLEEICQDLKIDSIWPMIHSNRLFARSYKDKFYYSFKQNVDDEFIIDYIKAYYKVVRDLFNEFKPDLVFTAAFVYEGHIVLNHFADKFNIPIISITDSRVPGYYLFTNNYLDKKSPFLDRFAELQNGSATSSNSQAAKKFIYEFRQKMKKPLYHKESKQSSFWQKIIKEIIPYKQVIGWYIKNKRLMKSDLIKSVGPTPEYRPPKIILRDHYCQKKYKKFADNYPYYPFNELGKFVFYPLQFTPEGGIDLTSPLFSNQIESARQIAMSLPGDYTLAVKEHPGMVGYRPPSYLEKVDRTPNVKLIDYRISSEAILKKSDMVISPCGTIIFEAAIYHKPVIMLSDIGLFKALPNVFQHSDMATLSSKIKKVLSINLKTNEYEKQLENYISAAFDVGFNADYRGVWYDGKNEALNKLIDIFVNEIKRSLKDHEPKKNNQNL